MQRMMTMKTKAIVLALLLLLFAALVMQGAAAADVYNAGDIAVIHRIIDDNGLDWEKWTTGSTPPASWELMEKYGVSLKGVEWSDAAADKRIVGLDVSNEGLTGTLDMSGLIELTWLSCGFNNLSALDVTECDNLKSLSCGKNNLSALNVSKNANLKSLSCSSSGLSALDVTECIELERLACGNNNLSTLDVSKNIKLKSLYCVDNQLNALDVTKCVNLETLFCYNNNLSALNVAECVSLKRLACYNNTLSHLKLLDGYELNVIIVPEGSGTVTLDAYDYSKGRITLSAEAMGDSSFGDWTVDGLLSEPRTHGSTVSF